MLLLLLSLIFLLVLVELDGETAFTAMQESFKTEKLENLKWLFTVFIFKHSVLPVFVVAQEDTGTAHLLWAFFSFSFKFSDIVNFVEFKSGQLNFGPLVLDLLWGSVDLLLPLSATSQNWGDDLDGAFGLDTKVFQSGIGVVQDGTVSHQSSGFSGHSLKLTDGGFWGDLQSLSGFAFDENLHFYFF